MPREIYENIFMYNPISTYRVQFNKDYGFKHFREQIDYFSLLGIKTIYASPVFRSVPGSMHGYDVTNPLEFNPELGNEEDFTEIILKLKEKNIGWIQDIVPNHMAIHIDNNWLVDVLRKGSKSTYAEYFDIDFSHPDFPGKLMIPFLGKPLREAIAQGEIKLILKDGNLGFSYFDFFLPVSEETENLLYRENDLNEKGVLNSINTDTVKLKEVLDNQHYILTFWKEAGRHLNSRRFFTINSLISLKMENQRVFEDYHRMIIKLVSEKMIQGLRIDHIDGLREPLMYIERLRVLTGGETYIVVEKILGNEEHIDLDWPLQGTTGYDFLAKVNNLLTFQKNYILLEKFYRDFTGVTDDPENIIYQKKKLILQTSMRGDLGNLFRMFEEADFPYDHSRITPENMKNSIAEFLLSFPRYKLYSWSFPLASEDLHMINMVINRAAERNPLMKNPLKVLHNLFTAQHGLTSEKKEDALNFFLRCMQFTGPLMAKGIEDTVMYYYNCFIAHNEVGDAVNARGLSIKEFHEDMKYRQKAFPMTQNTTSTHDTKRGEDVRSRLNVISELPHEWIIMVKRWSELNKAYKTLINGENAPNANEEYFIYQTIVGIYPFEEHTNENLLSRLDEYIVKALREAKINSDWGKPDTQYEKAAANFIREILQPGSDFLRAFYPLQKKISTYGIFNSITQLFLKATCPGIPDFYQGTELWDLSLVDPDNRRPVDYNQRQNILNDMIVEHAKDPRGFSKRIFLEPETGHLKLWLTHVLIKERTMHPDLFTEGRYLPLTVKGKYKNHVLAFARIYKNIWYIVVVPLYLGVLCENLVNEFGSGRIEWNDTSIGIPATAPSRWTSVLDCRNDITGNKISVSILLQNPFPCLLKGTKEKS